MGEHLGKVLAAAEHLSADKGSPDVALTPEQKAKLKYKKQAAKLEAWLNQQMDELYAQGVSEVKPSFYGMAPSVELAGKPVQHVKTPQGAKWYHQPIGSIIYKKPSGHVLQQHERLIIVGTHTFVVPKDATVFIASGTDMSDDAAVAAAPKALLVAEPGKPGKFVRIDPIPEGSGVSQDPYEVPGPPVGKATVLKEGWKLLSKVYQFKEPPVPVSTGGKLQAWVPSDWQLYDVGTKTAHGVWGKDPSGKWHLIKPDGNILDEGGPGWNMSPGQLEMWITTGKHGGGGIKPYVATGTIPEAAIPPVTKTGPGPSPAVVDVGGVPATAGQISSALDILHKSMSTAVKQPLVAHSHPLKDMDYHAVAKAEIKKFPELKVPPGSKTQHVGQVKLAVMHHLAGKLKELAAIDAAHAQADATQKQAIVEAKHGAETDPKAKELHDLVANANGVTLPGKVPNGLAHAIAQGLLLAYDADHDQYISDAVGGGYSFSAVLPAIFHFRVTPQHEVITMAGQAYSPGKVLGYVKQYLPPLSAGKTHDEAVQQKTKFGKLKPGETVKAFQEQAGEGDVKGWNATHISAGAAVQWALDNHQNAWIYPDALGVWHAFATAQGGGLGGDWYHVDPAKAGVQVYKGGVILTKAALDKLLGTPEPDTDAAKLHELVTGHGLVQPFTLFKPSAALAMALKIAFNTDETQYVSQDEDTGVWHISPNPKDAQFMVTPQHGVESVSTSGVPNDSLLPGQVLANVEQYFSKHDPEADGPQTDEEAAAPAGAISALVPPVPKQVLMIMHGLSTDSLLYYQPNTSEWYVHLPGGMWKTVTSNGGEWHTVGAYPQDFYDNWLDQGKLVPAGNQLPYEPQSEVLIPKAATNAQVLEQAKLSKMKSPSDFSLAAKLGWIINAAAESGGPFYIGHPTMSKNQWFSASTYAPYAKNGIVIKALPSGKGGPVTVGVLKPNPDYPSDESNASSTVLSNQEIIDLLTGKSTEVPGEKKPSPSLTSELLSAAIAKGNPIVVVPAGTAPGAAPSYVQSLPGFALAKIAAPYAKQNSAYAFYYPSFGDHPWAWTSNGPDNQDGEKPDLGKGYWEAAPTGAIVYHPPQDTSAHDQMLAAAAKAWLGQDPMAINTLPYKLGKALDNHIKPKGSYNKLYVYPLGSVLGYWGVSATSHAKGYKVETGGVVHNVETGNLLSDAEVTALLEGMITPGEATGKPESKTVKFKLSNGKSFEVPAGSVVYHTASHTADNADMKWVKLPEGNWKAYAATGKVHDISSQDSAVANGTLVPEGYVPDAPSAGPDLPVLADGKVVAKVPAGTKFYKAQKTSAYNPASYTATYLHLPNGEWKQTSYGSLSKAWGAESWVTNGYLKEVPPPTEEDIKHAEAVAALKEMLTSGAVDPKPGVPPKDSGGYALAAAAAAAVAHDGDQYAWFDDKGSVQVSLWKPDDVGHLWQVHFGSTGDPAKQSFEAEEYTPGQSEGEGTPIPFAQVEAAVKQYLTPQALVMDGKLYKAGYYYKAKGKGAVEVVPGKEGQWSYKYWKYGDVAKHNKFMWHAANGDVKELTPTAAQTKLADTTWHDKPKAESFKLSGPPKFATTVFPSLAYATWDPSKHAKSNFSVVFHADGSASTSTTPHANGDNVLIDGVALDEYGNSVVKPGLKVEEYHLFGELTFTPQQMQQMLDKFQQVDQSISVKDTLGIEYASDAYVAYVKFMKAKAMLTGAQQRQAITGLLRELLFIPSNENAVSKVEPVFLKSMPPGVHQAKDVFSFTDTGMAKPHVWKSGIYGGVSVDGTPINPAAVNFWAMNNTDAKALIKQISEEFGGGKVIGTHPSGLSGDDPAKWLTAFKAGDMVTVFGLDAQGGKVSPAHPGAPDNTTTHQILWSSWDPAQVPAAKTLPGEWTNFEDGIVIPKAEIDNYILAAGLAHAEYLSAAERRSWVTWHRKHDQDQVDALTKEAFDRFESKANTLTEPPVFTKDIKPAKAYDAYLEDKTPASQWTVKAKQAFVNDFWTTDELKAALGDWGEEQGSSLSMKQLVESSYYQAPVIQKYLDNLAAAELAEKLKPKYHVEAEALADPDAPGKDWTRVADQHGWQGWWTEGSPALRNQERALSALTKSLGFREPELREAELDGVAGIARQIPEGGGTLSGAGAWQLTPRMASDVAREHVLDWLLDNPQGHPGNLFRNKDGSVSGLSKLDAYGLGSKRKWGEWQGLALDGSQDAYSQLMSTQLYQGVIDHSVPQDVADQAYIDTIRTAKRMQLLPDARFRELLEQMFKGRKVHPDIDEIMARKNQLAADFAGLWDKVYKQAQLTIPDVPEEKLRFGLHSGFTEPGFIDHVIAAKSKGVPAFFSNPDLDNSSVLTWTELAGDGPDAPRLLRGELQVRGPSLKALAAWAQQHVTHAPQNLHPAVPAPPSPDPKGAGTYYKHILFAAKNVSRHAQDQMFEGPYTKGSLEQMAKDKEALESKLAAAEDAIAKGPDSKLWATFLEANGNAQLVQDMAKHMLGLIAKVEEAKANAGTFKPGDIPEWKLDKSLMTLKPKPKPKEPEPPKPPEPPYKVALKTVVRELGVTAAEIDAGNTNVLGKDDGELHLHGKTKQYPGTAWHVTLPTGEVLELNDSTTTTTPPGQVGRIRFKGDATQGAASLENIRGFLDSIGVKLDEADDQDMELFYWRDLARTLADRQDWNQQPYNAVWQELAAASDNNSAVPTVNVSSQNGAAKAVEKIEHAGLPKAEEIDLWRKAWAHVTSDKQVKDFADKGGYLPYLKHWDTYKPEVPGGKPVWYRFDAQTPEMTKWLAQQSVGHNFYHSDRDALLVARTGGTFSTEARLRALGTSVTGTSSAGDMKEKGSAGYLFTGPGKQHVAISPKVFAQTHTYGWDSDYWGNITYKKSHAYFNIKKAVPHSSQETMLEDGVSLLSDIEAMRAATDPQRNQIVHELKSHGVTSIRGLPVEARIKGNSYDSPADSKTREALKGWSAHWWDRPEAYIAPPSGVITSGAVETEAEVKGQSAIGPGGMTEAVTGFEPHVEHHVAAQAKDISQMFYHADKKPSSDHTEMNSTEAKQAKAQVAQRVAAEMHVADDQMAALLSDPSVNLTVLPDWGKNKREKMVAGLVKVWASTNSNAIALAMQQEAHDLFGVPKPMLEQLGGGYAADLAGAKKLEEKYGPVLREFLRSMWQLTQDDMQAHNLDQITLHRIMFFNDPPKWAHGLKAGDVIDVPQQRSIASWGFLSGTAGVKGAGLFGPMGAPHHVLVKATFPRQRVLSYPRTGFGSYNETEFTVLDSPGKWEVVEAQ